MKDRTGGPEPSLFRAALVVLRWDGVSIPRLHAAPPWDATAEAFHPVGVAELHRLLAWRRSGTGVPAGADDEFDQLLDEFGLLVASPGDHQPASLRTDDAEPARSSRSLAPVEPDGALKAVLPIVLRVGSTSFDAFDHDGRQLAALTPEEVVAAAGFCTPRTVADAMAHQRQVLADASLDQGAFDRLVRTLADAHLLEAHDPDLASPNFLEEQFRAAFRAELALVAELREVHAGHDREEATRARVHGERVKVVPVQVAGNIPPLSLGMVVAHLRERASEAVDEAFDLHPRWITRLDDAPAPGPVPTIYLFTNYLWSHEQNLEFARALKARDPRALTVHGGPDCPTYPADTESYLHRNPQVDVMVRGEGEATAVHLLEALAESIRRPAGPDLSVLADVPGLAYRATDGSIVRTEARPRLEQVDLVPSPYLTGVFDVFGATRQMGMAIIETNRGCPYGCTFCDWGSATNSRIRQFDLQRVLDEFEWCAAHEVPRIFVADANFGIFARDVDIARHVVELKARYGFPKRFISNYAKNTVKHLKEIVSILAAGGVLSEGLLSLQSMDADTLRTIRRSNIKLDKYEALAREFHHADMPLFVDLMLGLPGQSPASLREDLQQCVDREVSAKVHATELLVNSPMNDPDYRHENALVTSRPAGVTGEGVAAAARRGPSLVISSSTFTRDDYRDMDLMRRSYLLTENFGVLRQVTRFVRRETGIREVDLLERIRRDCSADPDRRPHLTATMLTVPLGLVPPVSWRFFVDELRDYLVEVVGLRPDSSLDTVLAVQHALLPTPGRQFPVRLDLPHDLAAWHRSVLDAKDGGNLHDWEAVVPRLADHGPGQVVVDDPRHVCTRNMGTGSAIDAYQDWELASPVARAMPGHYQ